MIDLRAGRVDTQARGGGHLRSHLACRLGHGPQARCRVCVWGGRPAGRPVCPCGPGLGAGQYARQPGAPETTKQAD